MSAIKCVMLGDGGVGKSCLLKSYIQSDFQCSEYVPTTNCDFYAVSVDGYTIDLRDTGGHDNCNEFGALLYPQTDVFLLCFSVVQPITFENVEKKWLPIIKQNYPNTPFVLIGMQTDLRMKTLDQNHITLERGHKLANQFKNAVKYVECSALIQNNLNKDALNNYTSLVKLIVGAATVGAVDKNEHTIQSMPTMELIRLNESEMEAERQLYATYQSELFPKMHPSEDEEEAWRWAEDKEQDEPTIDPFATSLYERVGTEF